MQLIYDRAIALAAVDRAIEQDAAPVRGNQCVGDPADDSAASPFPPRGLAGERRPSSPVRERVHIPLRYGNRYLGSRAGAPGVARSARI
jgi:hypothetical protein